jgi:2,3-bisphosphoglycerate-dependent phosphoglycerate mutase
MKRSKVYWEDRLAPALKAGKTVLVVGHENNLRSLLMQLEGIPEDTIVNLSLPRAVPLAYRLDENLQPMSNNGALDEATGFLRGEWLGGDKAVAEILERDHKQVYDTSVQTNLELGKTQEKWRRWMEFAIGNTSEQPEMAAHSNPVQHLNGTGENPINSKHIIH